MFNSEWFQRKKTDGKFINVAEHIANHFQENYKNHIDIYDFYKYKQKNIDTDLLETVRPLLEYQGEFYNLAINVTGDYKKLKNIILLMKDLVDDNSHLTTSPASNSIAEGIDKIFSEYEMLNYYPIDNNSNFGKKTQAIQHLANYINVIDKTKNRKKIAIDNQQ